MSIYEINAVNVKQDVDTQRIKKNSPIVEVFSALSRGVDAKVDAKTKDKAVETIKEISSKAKDGDHTAVSEMNTIVRFAIEPKLLEAIQLLSFMGSYKQIAYNEAAMMKTYNYESVDARFQASSGDVPFATYNFREYPIPTQTISSGFSIDYRELESGNFDGTTAEGMNQVIIDMQNKGVYYAMTKLYEGLKNAKGVKHFAEAAGIAQASVDDMLKIMRRYGKVSIMGDYSAVSQLNGFAGYKTFGANTIPFGADAVADEIRKTGLLSYYNGANVVEIPNAFNWTKMNADKSSYELYMPEGFLWMIPTGNVAPLQMFLRGGLTSMTADDIVTRQHMTRFDMEIGAGLAEGMEHMVGLISDTNYEAPSI